MRSKIISGAFLALILVFSACKKDKNSIDPVVKPPTNAALAAKVDGVNFQSTDAGAVASNDSHSFLLSATDAQDNSISLTGPTALGTYTDVTNDETSGFYISKDGALWMSSMGGTVTLTITKYDVNSKKMSGTFTFTAPAAGSDATGTKTVTNGSFTDVPFLVQ
jgi:hypothetical protein